MAAPLNRSLTVDGQAADMTRTALRPRILALSALACGSLLAAPLAVAFGVGLQPSTVEMTAQPGKTQRQVVTIGNVHTDKTISLTLSLADWGLDEAGQLVLDAPGDTERSAADWVRFSPAEVTLKPETKTDVVVEISTPAKVAQSGDHRFALLATTRIPEERDGMSGVWSKYQLASLFYLTFTPSSSDLKVSSVEPLDDAPGTLRMVVENEGDAHGRLQGLAYVKSASGDIVGEMEVNTVVLEHMTRRLDLAMPTDSLAPGDYTVDFELKNAFVPQNGFRPIAVPADSITYVTP